MNELSTETNNRNKHCQVSLLDTEKIVESKTSSDKNKGCIRKLLPLRTTKKSYNLLEVAKNEDVHNVVIVQLVDSSVNDGLKMIDLKNTCTEFAKNSKISKPLSRQTYLNAPTPRSEINNKVEKLPPIIPKNSPFKHKANETVSKRGTNSTSYPLPPASNVKKRAVSKIPKYKIPSTTKIALSNKLSKPLAREKKLNSNLDVQKSSQKFLPIEKLRKISTKESEDLGEGKSVEDILLIQKLPGISNKISNESVASTEEFGEITTFEGFKKVANMNTYPLNLCDMSNSEEKMSSKRLEINNVTYVDHSLI